MLELVRLDKMVDAILVMSRFTDEEAAGGTQVSYAKGKTEARARGLEPIAGALVLSHPEDWISLVGPGKTPTVH